MSANQTIQSREVFVQAMRYMGEEDLLYLNRTVVERLALLNQARSNVQLTQFAKGDRVRFTNDDGTDQYATLLRLNKKSTSCAPTTDSPGRSRLCFYAKRPEPDRIRGRIHHADQGRIRASAHVHGCG